MRSESKDLIAVVRVVKHLPMGLGVETVNGDHGIIRLREISWDPNRLELWKQSYPIGWHGEAYRLSAKKGQFTEFSLRLAKSDPWEELPEIIGKGKLYEGIVTGIVDYGVFVEIASGITGLLHRSELPVWVTGSPIDLFWPGDRMFVTVQEIKYQDRKIVLGFPKSTQQIEQKDFTRDGQSLVRWDSFDHEMDVFLKQNTQKKHYLVVEDEHEQAFPISSWLRHLGQRVDVFANAEDALVFLEKITPDFAFIDVGLPNMDGVELSRIILEKWPRIRVIVTTDWAQAESVTEELEELQRQDAELLIKPLLPEDVIGVIRKIDSERPNEQTELKNPKLPDIVFDQGSTIRSSNLKRNLLNQLRHYLGFELVILFSIEKSHHQVSILEFSGDEKILNTAAIPQLIYSPVRDVAEDQTLLVINDIQSYSHNRARYLLELYPYLTACIGVPVFSRMQSDFALFALDKHPYQINSEQITYVEAISLVIGAHLEHENFNERSVLIQRSALIGQLTRGMVHEINNLVGPLHSRLDYLQVKLKDIKKKQNPAEPMSLDNDMITNELSEIQNNVRKIINTTRMFGRVAAKGKNEVLRVDEIVDETIHFMRDISDRLHVKITLTPIEHLLVIRNQAAALEQVLLNVLLNAVQQIKELHADSGGWVRVEIEPPYEEKGLSFFRILIKDNGPGIHTALWERVFEAGYTTRADGSGVGLYISLNLMNDMGGRIYVRESHILSGTTFVLEIPYHL